MTEALICSPNLTNVTFPSNVTSINCNCFDGCSQLESVNLSQCNLTSIPDGLFSSCGSLETAHLPPSLAEIGAFAFKGCSNLENVTLDENCQHLRIGESAFEGCSSLNFEIPETVTEIGKNCFKSSGMVNVRLINGSLYNVSLGDGCFANCAKLNSAAVINFAILPKFTFYECTKLTTVQFSDENEDPEGETEITEETENTEETGNTEESENTEDEKAESAEDTEEVSESIEVEESETPAEIGESAFEGCYSLENFELPKSVKKLGRRCFMMSNVLKVDLESVTEIGYQAFQNCINLTSAINLSLSSIQDCTFCGCTSLTSVTFISDVSTIGESAFEGCSSLQNIIIPNSVNTLKKKCFMSSRIQFINLNPSTFVVMGEQCFQDCTSLENVTIYNIGTIPNYGFYGCVGLKIAIFTCMNYTQNIGESAFEECYNLSVVQFLKDSSSVDKYVTSDDGESKVILEGDFKFGKHSFRNTNVATVRAVNSKPELYGYHRKIK